MKADLSPTGRALRALELLQAQPGITGGQLVAQLDVTERAEAHTAAAMRAFWPVLFAVHGVPKN